MSAETKPTNDSDHPEIIDLEEYAKANRPVPPDRRYQIRIDRERFVVNRPTITGREILALVNKKPEDYILHQRLRGGAPRTIEAEDKVDLTGHGPERFMTLKRETQEGLAEGRRHFKLAAADGESLAEQFPKWEAVLDGTSQWVVIREFKLPPGYNVATADLAIQLVAGYPDAALDMAYFSPDLQRADGKAIPALSPHQFDGRNWQRWSRHRTGSNPWVPGEDCLSTHISYIKFFLAEEFKKRP